MKKYLLIACSLLLLVLSGCSNPKCKLSDGIENLAQQAVDDYDDFISAKITKDELISNVEKYEKQADDISGDILEDIQVTSALSELLTMLNNGIADKDDYDLPICDLKTLLSGDEIKKIDSDWKNYEFNNIYFNLPKGYILTSETKNSQTYSYGLKIIQIYSDDKFIDTFDDDTFAEYIENFNENGFNLSTNMDVYFSRRCDFFYKSTGKKQLSEDNYNVELYTCLDDDEAITFLFYSVADFDEGVNEQILNDAIF